MSAPAVIALPYVVGAADADAFDKQGYARVHDVLDPATVAMFGAEIAALPRDPPPLDRRFDAGTEGTHRWVVKLWQQGDPLHELVFSRRLARLAADLLAVRSVRLLRDEVLLREPGSRGTPWHADQTRWPLAGDRVVTMSVPLHKVTEEMGPLVFARGSHRIDHARLVEQNGPADPTEYGIFDIVTEPVDAGDVIVHLGWTLHRTHTNRTDRTWSMVNLVYMDADIEVIDPLTPQQGIELQKAMPGARVGHVPDTALNPVLYRDSIG